MHAGGSLKPKYPIITPDDLKTLDGFILGFPTRYGRTPAQVSAFFDQTGGLWASGALVGKFAGIFLYVTFILVFHLLGLTFRNSTAQLLLNTEDKRLPLLPPCPSLLITESTTFLCKHFFSCQEALKYLTWSPLAAVTPTLT